MIKNAIRVIKRALEKFWSTLCVLWLNHEKWVRFSPKAIIPTQGTSGSAGFDLYSVDDALVSPSSAKLIRTNIDLKISSCYFEKIHLRSSFALRFTDVGSGVIDSDYRDPIGVIFFTFSSKFIHIGEGERLAQIVFQKIAIPQLKEVASFEIEEEERGLDTYGSTGNRKQCQKKSLWISIFQIKHWTIWNGTKGTAC